MISRERWLVPPGQFGVTFTHTGPFIFLLICSVAFLSEPGQIDGCKRLPDFQADFNLPGCEEFTFASCVSRALGLSINFS